MKIGLKILFDIQKKYEKPELHICYKENSNEMRMLRDRLEDMLFGKLTVYGNQETRTVSISDIERIYSENKRVYVRTAGDTFEVRERLYSLEEKLKDSGFLRISNSEIVNMSMIEKLDMGIAGTIKMHMKNGDITYVSRRYVSTIRKTLG